MISENITSLQERIEHKCSEVNRNSSEIKLVAVSKTFGTDDIEKVYSEGLRDFGENKAQELSAKYEILGDKITWHFIGHLQRNKVRNNPFHKFSTFDTATLSALAYGQTVLARSAAAAGLEFDEKEAHSAAYDCERTAELFCRIVNHWHSISTPGTEK